MITRQPKYTITSLRQGNRLVTSRELVSISTTGAVTSIFGRTGAVVAATNDYTWAQINKTISDLADIATKSHTSLTDKGTNTHAQIDTHIANTSNPHSVTKSQVGLGSVPNTDCTNPANIVQDSTHRFATDTEKGAWNGKQDALGFTPENNSNKVITFQITPDDTHYPSEKLVKDSLNAKQDSGSYEVTTNKDATGGYVGLTLFKINFKNVLNTITSFFTNSNTVARTYTFQDRDGTIADNTDLAGKSDTSHNHSGVYEPIKGADDNYVTDAEKIIIGNTSGTNTGDNATNSQYSGLAASKENALTGATLKNTIHDNDRFIQLDSESLNATSYNLWSVIKSTLITALNSVYVVVARTVNGKALSGNITLSLASADFANQGTTTTVLHGNAAGNPAFGAIVEADVTLSDNTTLNVSTSKHGLVPKLTNDTTKFLRDDGTFAVPAGGATLWATWTGAARGASDGIIDSSSLHLALGTAIRFKATAGTYRHAYIKSLSTDAHTIVGEPCTIDDDDVFEYDTSGLKSGSQTIHLPDNYNDADDDTLLVNDLNMILGWKPAICGAYMIAGIEVSNKSSDTGTDADLNLVQFGTTNKLFTDVPVATAEANSGVTAVTAYCYGNGESSFDVSVDKNGNGDAYDADIIIRWVIL